MIPLDKDAAVEKIIELPRWRVSLREGTTEFVYDERAVWPDAVLSAVVDRFRAEHPEHAECLLSMSVWIRPLRRDEEAT